MKRIITAILAASLCLTAYSQAALRSYVQELNQKEPLKSSVWGVLAVRMNGDTLVAFNQGQKMVPASNTKLITTGSALTLLGADYRFHTAIAYDGEVKDSTLVGDVYIIGGGDPTLGSKDENAEPADRLFGRWQKILADAGIYRIEGDIIGDGRRMDCYGENFSWTVDDLGWYYGVGTSALNWYENRQDFFTVPGTSVGDPVSVSVIYPKTPWMKYSHSCTTSPAGCGDELYYLNSRFVPIGEMRGTLAVDKGTRKQECSNRFPALTCAAYFMEYLQDHGTSVSGSYADIDNDGAVRHDPMVFDGRRAATAQDGLTIAGSTASPKLSDIIKECLYESDNFYAEALLKAIGQEITECASYDSSLVAEKKILAGLGLNPDSAVQIVDGSGLSRKNYITPSFFVDFLKAMMRTSQYETYLHLLPQPGKGTLTSRLSKAPESLRGRVWMKSGSMNGVRCFSGYITPEDGKTENTIVFSVMTNNVTVPTYQVNLIMDKIITLIGE